MRTRVAAPPITPVSDLRETVMTTKTALAPSSADLAIARERALTAQTIAAR